MSFADDTGGRAVLPPQLEGAAVQAERVEAAVVGVGGDHALSLTGHRLAFLEAGYLVDAYAGQVGDRFSALPGLFTGLDGGLREPCQKAFA